MLKGYESHESMRHVSSKFVINFSAVKQIRLTFKLAYFLKCVQWLCTEWQYSLNNSFFFDLMVYYITVTSVHTQ